MYLTEALTKAEQGMGFVCTDLRAAVGEADAVTTAHLLELCEEANRLLARITVVVEAMETKRITAKGD